MMPKWTVSYTVYYSVEVEAETQQEAIDKADAMHDWERSDSDFKAEKA
jgi:hypothetical protein